MFKVLLQTRERLLERDQEPAHHSNNSAPDNQYMNLLGNTYMGCIDRERGKSASVSYFFFTLGLNYTYYEIYHRKSKVMSITGLRSIVRICCQNPIRPGGPPRGALNQAKF